MESDWIDYKCKSGQTIFIYNKVTGVHKWPPGFNNGSSEDSIMVGQPVEYKELHSIATQTDDYDCNNGCTSMYINTDPNHVSNTSETLPQPQPGVSVDGEHDLDNEHDPETLPQPQPGVSVDCEYDLDNDHDPENTLEDEDDELEQSQDLDEISTMLRVMDELELPPGNTLVDKENEAKDDSAGGDNAEKRQLLIRIHSGEKRFECSYCKKKFRGNCELKRHLRIHTGEKPFECSYCKKKFATKSNLNAHRLKIHLSREALFECSYCKKKLSTRYNLKRHLTLH